MPEETNTLIVFCTIAVIVFISMATYFIWNSIHPETCVSEIKEIYVKGFEMLSRPNEILCDNSVTMNDDVPFFVAPLLSFYNLKGDGKCYYKVITCTRK